MSDKPKPPAPTRKAYPRINFRVSDAELSKIEMDAAAQGLSVGAYLRWLALDSPQTRPTRRPLPGEASLRQLKGEAGKVDGNLAQLLRMANRGEAMPVDAIEDAASAVRNCWLHIIEMLKGAQ